MIDKGKKREVQNDVTDGRGSMVNALNDARTSDHEGHLNCRGDDDAARVGIGWRSQQEGVLRQEFRRERRGQGTDSSDR